jgi:hypothetical protein
MKLTKRSEVIFFVGIFSQCVAGCDILSSSSGETEWYEEGVQCVGEIPLNGRQANVRMSLEIDISNNTSRCWINGEKIFYGDMTQCVALANDVNKSEIIFSNFSSDSDEKNLPIVSVNRLPVNDLLLNYSGESVNYADEKTRGFVGQIYLAYQSIAVLLESGSNYVKHTYPSGRVQGPETEGTFFRCYISNLSYHNQPATKKESETRKCMWQSLPITNLSSLSAFFESNSNRASAKIEDSIGIVAGETSLACSKYYKTLSTQH